MTDDHDDTLSPDEIARRRDEVIRRMANTPPQPRSTPKESAKKAKPFAVDQKSPKNGGGALPSKRRSASS